MRSKLHLLIVICFSLLVVGCSSGKKQPVNEEMEDFVEGLLAQMTLEEKIGQMTLFAGDMDQTGQLKRKDIEEDIKLGRVGAIFNNYGAINTRRLQEFAIKNTRLRIPLLFGLDVIHGFKTIFPVPLAEAASWDLQAIEKSARIAAIEASAVGLNWTFAPVCDISRDPRWGRIVEGAGEDPYLASLIARARVRGFQGENLKANNTLAACVKHFAAYGAVQAGREYNSVDMSERMLREVYLPPYQAAVDEGALTLMTAFNDLNGVPASASKFLLTDILRNEWNFDGFVVTDYTSIMELIQHGVATDEAQASEISLKAGVDMDMQSGFFQKELAKLVEQNIIEEEQINTAVRRILKVKYQLGLFEDPFRYCSDEREQNEIMAPEFLEAARDIARKSIVLLKNKNNLLPLSKELKTIAVIGPLADAKIEMNGSWAAAGDRSKSVTLLEGLRAKLPEMNLIFAKGCEIDGTVTDGFAEAIAAAMQSEVVILAIGEAASMSGEAASRSDIGLPGVQQELVEALHKTGKPIVVVLINGRPLTINWIDEKIPAIIEAWFPGTQGGHAISDVLFGDYNPSGKLPVTFPKNVGQIPIYYSSKNTGRPFDPKNKYTSHYLDVSNDPLYVFGYGLNYTTFEYGEIMLDKNSMTDYETLEVSVEVTNTGKIAGEEVVQLYIQDAVASLTRPVRELKGFKKIMIEPGQSVTATFTIKPSDLAFYDQDMHFTAEKGEFRIYIGGNSRDTKSAVFELK
ncbi:MAG: beta-glucosidase BglX [Bacteroidales bacterium]|nr:beta-glucosidase BglX [Bacteroidales bacterium]